MRRAIGTLCKMSRATEVFRHTLRGTIMLPCGNCREYDRKDSFETFKLRQNRRQLSSYSRISCILTAFVCKIGKTFRASIVFESACREMLIEVVADVYDSWSRKLSCTRAAKEEFTGQLSRSIRFNQPQQQFIRKP